MATNNLTDTNSFGEDLTYNALVIAELAECHCTSCKDYHVGFVYKRLEAPGANIEIDRSEIAEFVKSIVQRRLSTQIDQIEIVIAGASDTGVLSSAAHGVALIGPAALERTRFVVLDRCQTPLELCAAFAERHRLNLTTEVVEIDADEASRRADIVIVHSLLRFIPQAGHVRILRKFGTWLRPDGRIIFSTRLETVDNTPDWNLWRGETAKSMLQRIKDGTVSLTESSAEFEARARRLADRPPPWISHFSGLDGLLVLFSQASLPVYSCDAITKEIPSIGRGVFRSRAVAVIGAPE